MIALFAYMGIIVALGALFCFKGRDLFFPMIAILAFLCGFGLYISYAGVSERDLIIGVVIGLVAGLLARFIYMVGVFFSGLIAGFIFGGLLTSLMPEKFGYTRLVIAVAAAVLIAVLAVKWLDFFISLSTAMTGSSLMAVPCCFMVMNLPSLTTYIGTSVIATVNNVNRAMNGQFAEKQALVILIVTAVIFVLGMVVQMKTNSKMKKRK